jgi:hypothetical protein
MFCQLVVTNGFTLKYRPLVVIHIEQFETKLKP